MIFKLKNSVDERCSLVVLKIRRKNSNHSKYNKEVSVMRNSVIRRT